MFVAPLRRYLTSNIDRTGNHLIYSVGDDKTIFYIGQSIDVVGRIRAHAILSSPTDELGRLVMANFPQSLDWPTRIYTLKDCSPAVYEYYFSDEGSYGGYYDKQEALDAIRGYKRAARLNIYEGFMERYSGKRLYAIANNWNNAIQEAEKAMIAKYTPPGNITFNRYTRPPYPATVNKPCLFLHMYSSVETARTALNDYLRIHLQPVRRKRKR